MRVLIAGGGVGGLTLAGLLEQRGIHPVVVEKAHRYGDVGFVLALWPVGSRVLKGLGLYQLFEERSVTYTTYSLVREDGSLIKRYELDSLNDRFGPLRGIARSAMLSVLQDGCRNVEIRMGTTVEGLIQEGKEVAVQFSDGTRSTFDLVVGCDGIHSRVRELLFGPVPVQPSGWSTWAFWVNPTIAESIHLVKEYWAPGRFVGLFPAKDRLVCYLAAPFPPGRKGIASRDDIRRLFSTMGGEIPALLEQMPEQEEIFHDDLQDLKTPDWYRGRVLLLGDAADAILPTAGLGASMAMESAAVLADELSRSDAQTVHRAIDLYVRRRRRRVERVVDSSRGLARYIMVSSPLLVSLRDLYLHFTSVDTFTRDLRHLLEDPF